MSGTTISGTSMSGVTLTQAADNPALVTGTITVASGTALYGADDMAWTVTNAGLLGSEAGYGVSLAAGGSVTNQATGTIYGYQAGVKITGAAGTVVNAGSIAGSGTAADAVSLAAGYANTVIVDPGASFIGTVDGGNAPGSGPASVLELASAAGAGTLTGLGTAVYRLRPDHGRCGRHLEPHRRCAGRRLCDRGRRHADQCRQPGLRRHAGGKRRADATPAAARSPASSRCSAPARM